jgi:hypothetical protein
MGPIFAHVMTPAPLTEVLTQGPTDSADQQVFVGGYIGANKSLRVKFAWIGFALSFVFYGAGCVACTTLGIGTLGTMGTM